MYVEQPSLGRFGDLRLDKRGRCCSTAWLRAKISACAGWVRAGGRSKMFGYLPTGYPVHNASMSAVLRYGDDRVSMDCVSTNQFRWSLFRAGYFRARQVRRGKYAALEQQVGVPRC